MGPVAPVFFFDYLDPVSYLQELELRSLRDPPGAMPVRRVPVELCVPPAPMMDPEGPGWRARWGRASSLAAALGIVLVEPRILFWTRKAHELALHAASRGLGDAVHRALFDAVFVEGRDIGRVDVLVSVAREAGLEGTATKVVLDVDTHAAEVMALRREAENLGVAEPPVVVLGGETLRGFHNRDALRTFLLR